MALIELEIALSHNNSLRPAQPLAKLHGFAGQLLGALHESRRRQAAIILREHAPLTQLRSGGANND